jgi:hypothetical protein
MNQKKTYQKIGKGNAFKNNNWDPNKKYPMFTGSVTIDKNVTAGEDLKVAIWRNASNGKEYLYLQFNKEEEA